MKIAILGFGREGQSILKFLKKNRQYKNDEIWIVDKKATIKLPRGIPAHLGKNYLKNLDRFDIIFRSPGVPYTLPEIQKAKKAGVKISSPTKFFFELCPAKIIGITGTKGKGTTSTLLYRILKAAAKKVFIAGNIGKPALDILPDLISINQRRNQHKSAYVILELSSFQLQDLEVSPTIAAVLTTFPDHLDLHKNLKEYYRAKENIARYQKKNDRIFYFRNNRLGRRIASKSPGKKIEVDEKEFKLFRPEDLKIKGWHNFQNAVMAATIARSLGVPPRIIQKAVKKFKGNEHRLEFVRAIRLSNISRIKSNSSRIRAKTDSKNIRAYSRKIREIKFYNDSASTSPQTTAAAIRVFPTEEKILIAGGYDKNLDYRPLAQALKNSGTRLVILFGQNKKKIQKAIKKSNVPIKLVKNLREAVKTAYHYSTFYILNSKFLNIIFSPGAASFDMFQNYADRGEQFKKIVRQLTETKK